MNAELQKKIMNFYKVKGRKFSINRPIDASETLFASGGPSKLIVRERLRNRREFLALDVRGAFLQAEDHLGEQGIETEINYLQDANDTDPKLK